MYDFRRMTLAERREILRQRWARDLPLHVTPHFRGVAGEYLITAACYEHQHKQGGDAKANMHAVSCQPPEKRPFRRDMVRYKPSGLH